MIDKCLATSHKTYTSKHRSLLSPEKKAKDVVEITEIKEKTDVTTKEQEEQAIISSNGTHAKLIVKYIYLTETSDVKHGDIHASAKGEHCLIDYEIINTSTDKTIVGYQADVIILNDYENRVVKTNINETNVVIAPNESESKKYLIKRLTSRISGFRSEKVKGFVIITKVLYSDGSLERGKDDAVKVFL